MTFSFLFFPDYQEIHRLCEQKSIKFLKGSLCSIFLLKKRRLLKKKQYLQALEQPYVSSLFEKYNFHNNDDLISQFWIRANIADFYNDVIFLLQYKILQVCTQTTCPNLVLGLTRSYKWIHEDTEPFINSYLSSAIEWISQTFTKDSFAISCDKQEIKDNQRVISLMIKMLFRFYAHVDESHSSIFLNDPTFEAYFRISFKFLISFGLKYQLLPEFEYDLVRGTISTFSKDETEFSKSTIEEDQIEKIPYSDSNQET